MPDTPLLFIVFNRPEVTARVWRRIRAVRPTRLFVASDAPRPDRPGEASRCAAVREVVGHVDWPCEFHEDHATHNLGAARRVSSALDWVFASVGEAIILEDDCLPDPTFFPFCTELLAHYRDDERIAQIAGCSFQGGRRPGQPSYYFSRYAHGWGWATWRRSWRHYDHAMTAWRDGSARRRLAEWIPDPAERQVWANCFDATLDGRVDAWDYRWVLSIWQRGALAIGPYQNLISNLGFGPDATHTKGASRWANLPLQPMQFPLAAPPAMNPDAVADARTGRLVFQPVPLAARVGQRLRQLLSW